MDAVLSTLTLEISVVTTSWPETRVKLIRYQLAGVFAGDLEFLANFAGQQDASAKWLFICCTASASLKEKNIDAFTNGIRPEIISA